MGGISNPGDMTRATYDADEDSRIEVDVLAWASGKMLKGAGASSNPTEVDGAVIATGNYGGNNTVNRAIAHGLGVTPKVIIWQASQEVLVEVQPGTIAEVIATEGAQTVTAPDATNFFVGNATNYFQSANANGTTYYWVALG